MRLIGRLLGWLGRRTALFLLLVAALLVWQARDQIGVSLGVTRSASEAHLADASALEDAADEIAAQRELLQRRLREAAIEAKSASVTELRSALQQARSEREQLASGKRPGWQQARSLAALEKERIIADRTLDLRIEMLDRKIAGLQATFSAADQALGAREYAQAAVQSCNRARSNLQDFNDDFFLWRQLRETLNQERTRLATEVLNRCREAREAVQQWRTARNTGVATTWGTVLSNETADLLERAAETRASAENTLSARFDRLWTEWRVEQVLWTAAGLLIALTLMPYAIRLLFYFVLAPLAERRGSIRLRVPGGEIVPLEPAPPSATSVAVRLAAGEELLVRQDYLQSSSLEGAKSTRWLLDVRHPLSSLATGLWFLTRICGENQVTTISAVRDPFAEVAVLRLPEGASCVLQPRALAAIVIPVGRPLRITSHWRLLSLNAWLTLQLRYLVFHGPARLVLKGSRGVRVEKAEEGRIFGQDLLIGFSADLAYSVRRTETFWPYFLGRETLLKDKVEAGKGLLILEEAPLAGRAAGSVRSGLEGGLDAALKAVGL